MKNRSLWQLSIGYGIGLLVSLACFTMIFPIRVFTLDGKIARPKIAVAPASQFAVDQAMIRPASHVDTAEQFPTTINVSSSVTPTIVCVGDGTSSKRVQVMYVHTVEVTSRYTETLPLIQQIAAEVDLIFDTSAHETNGHRHVRYVHDRDCQLSVLDVTIPVGADKLFSTTVIALQALGYNEIDRKYLLFVDASTYCGIATSALDSNPNPDSIHNHSPDYAWVGLDCWLASAAAHELVHTLGGVHSGAPHGTDEQHCTDEYDLMCYPDSPDTSPMTYPCDISHATLLDCNHDDYFHTDPPPDNYLATHWNVANSMFLLTEEEVMAQSAPSTIFLPLIRQ